MNDNIVDDDFILNLEFLHDNKNDMDFLKEYNIFFDMINQKTFDLNFKKKDKVEYILKDKIFNNVNYGKLSFNNSKFKKNIINDTQFIFVFDNGQLNLDNLNQILQIFVIIKNIIEKIIIGGSSAILYDPINNQQKIDLIPENLSRDLERMNFNNYNEIKNKIKKYIEDTGYYCDLFLENPYNAIRELSKDNNEYINSKKDFEIIFSYFVNLYKNTNVNNLKKNINFDNDDILCKGFINRIWYTINEYSDIYNNYYNKIIKNMDGIYIACLLKTYLCKDTYVHKLDALKFIYPELFEKYPMYEYFKILYIESIIYNDKKNDSE